LAARRAYLRDRLQAATLLAESYHLARQNELIRFEVLHAEAVLVGVPQAALTRHNRLALARGGQHRAAHAAEAWQRHRASAWRRRTHPAELLDATRRAASGRAARDRIAGATAVARGRLAVRSLFGVAALGRRRAISNIFVLLRTRGRRECAWGA
jgi:hypothetical protein